MEIQNDLIKKGTKPMTSIVPFLQINPEPRRTSLSKKGYAGDLWWSPFMPQTPELWGAD
jgi:hypothetical protein